jgi:purine catabolism regulator
VTVAEVLALDALVDAGLQVRAGADQLQREVSWVHAGEISDIARFLQGGELLLTAGTGIGPSTRDQQTYVKALHEAGASALVLELGRAFRSLPEPMRAAAERYELPVATLRRNVPFAAVMREVHGWIIGRRYALQTRAERMALEFNDLLLAGGSIPQIVHKLHEVTSKPALLEDAAHQLVEYAGRASDLDGIVDNWSEHSRLGHRDRPSDSGGGAGATCAWSSVVLRDERWGRIHVVAVGTDVDDLDHLAAERASAAVGLALLNDRHDARLAERRRADLLAEAERRAPQDAGAFLRQARSLGADFRGCELVALRVVGTEDVIEQAIQHATERAEVSELALLSSIEPDACRMLLGVPSDRDAASTARALADDVVRRSGEAHVVAGISRPTAVAGLPRAFHEASECLRFARVSQASGALEYATLGLHLLLASLVEGPELAAFVEAELGALLDYDAQARSPLLPTLRALLAHDSNRAEAARALHLERRSLYYRIGRIEQILGQSLNDYDVRLGLGVALRSLSLIEDRSISPRR